MFQGSESNEQPEYFRRKINGMNEVFGFAMQNDWILFMTLDIPPSLPLCPPLLLNCWSTFSSVSAFVMRSRLDCKFSLAFFSSEINYKFFIQFYFPTQSFLPLAFFKRTTSWLGAFGRFVQLLPPDFSVTLLESSMWRISIAWLEIKRNKSFDILIRIKNMLAPKFTRFLAFNSATFCSKVRSFHAKDSFGPPAFSFLKMNIIGLSQVLISNYIFWILDSATPIVIWHGLGQTSNDPNEIGRVKSLIENVTNSYVYSIKIGATVVDDLVNSYFKPANDQEYNFIQNWNVSRANFNVPDS